MKIIADKLTIVKISELKPFVDNPRLNEKAVAPVIKSMERFGYYNPIIVRKKDKMVIAGHTRLKALETLGVKEVPVIYVDVSENDAKLMNIADNKTGEFAEWDGEKLSALMSSIDSDWLSSLGSMEFQTFEIPEVKLMGIDEIQPLPEHVVHNILISIDQGCVDTSIIEIINTIAAKKGVHVYQSR